MSEKMDSLIQQLGELNTLIRDHKSDPATLDTEQLKPVLTEVMREIEAEKPKRLGETQDIAPVETPSVRSLREARVKGGKYDGMKVTDLHLAKLMLERAKLFHPEAPGPSEELLKAMDTSTSTAGTELVPTALAGELWEEFYLASRIAQAIGPVIPMPTDPWNIPLWTSFTWYKGTQNTATTASNPATYKNTLTTTELLAEVNWSYSLDEDSIIPMLPNLRAELVRSGAEKLDAFLLNADSTDAGTGNINLDDANPPDTSYYLSAGQDGIRHQWLVDKATQGTDAGGDALADGDFLSMQSKMGKYAVAPSDCFCICDVATYIKGFLNLDGVQTLDKYGAQAVLLIGELARYRGVPIVVSESAPLTEADGKVSTTAGNNTLGQVSCLNRRMWKAGTKRSLMIEVDRDIQKRQMIMVASFRLAVGCRYDGADRSGETHTAGIYNILV